MTAERIVSQGKHKLPQACDEVECGCGYGKRGYGLETCSEMAVEGALARGMRCGRAKTT